MDLKTAIALIENDDDADAEKVLSAWQWLVDEGHVWKLQGWYGRTAADMIDDGILRTAKPKPSGEPRTQ